MSCLVIVFSLILYCSIAKGDFRDVSTDQGVVRGYTVDADNMYSFYGIPYATPPTGEDRFKAALPPPTWDGIFNATENNIVCPQSNTFEFEVNITLDCLRIHVFVPDTQETNLPVLFYIHGGGHQSGFPGMYSPLNLVKRGMIVVNFNYRVGVYGFLCLNNEFAPGNAGMKDQVAALKWVKRNIANFGGDPDNITVGGSSAGSFCVELQILSPVSNGLFARAASISGSTIAEISFDRKPLKVAETFAMQLGVNTSRDIDHLENFYRSLSDEQLNFGFQKNHKQIGFSPCVETHNIPGIEKFMKDYPIDVLTGDNYEKVPYWSGFSSLDGLDQLENFNTYSPIMQDNFREFIPESIHFDTEEQAIEMTQMLKDYYFPTGEISLLEYAYFYSDLVFNIPIIDSARLHAKNGAPVYLYMFSYNGTINLPNVHNLPLWGPGHVSSQLYLQEHRETFIYENMTKAEFIIQEKLSDLYYRFVKDGIPSSHLMNETWKPVSVNIDFLHIHDELHFVMEQYPLRERMDLWDRLYNYHYVNSAGVSLSISVSMGIISILFVYLFNL